jgi:Concanavalin A-like lectin/glucanases superfamily
MIATISRELRLPGQKPPIGAVIDWSHQLARGLVGAWLLQEGGNAWRDYAGRYGILLLNPGTATGQVALAPSVGYIGGSARFLSANKHVLGPVPSVNTRIVPIPPFTFVASGLRTASAPNPASMMSDTYYEGTSGGAYALDIYNNNVRAGVYNPAVGYAAAVGSRTLATGTRYVLGAIYASTSLRTAYVNGLQDGTANTTAIAQPAGLNAFALGANYSTPSGSSFWDGWIDWAYYWSRALSAAEMLWLYQEPFGMFLPTVKRAGTRIATPVKTRSFIINMG